jgi:hypothetical protein
VAMEFLLLSQLMFQATIVDDSYNSPGAIGFIITFAVAVGSVALFFDMNRRIRRSRYRSEVRQKLAEEELNNIEVKKPDRPEPPARPKRESQE